MNKPTLIRLVLSVMLVAYLVVALRVSAMLRADDTCTGFVIEVLDTAQHQFVTAEGIAQELGNLPLDARGKKLSAINTDQIERHLDGIDDIEESRCITRADGSILLQVTPMRPVARVFDTRQGTSYYLNRVGKRMNASLRYRMDVPVVVNDNGKSVNPRAVLPLLDKIAQDSLWSSLVTAVKVDRNGDFILVPSIRGHVIVIGDGGDLDNKLDRVKTMYRKVMPVKGWTYYDTISVKWRGQVVATRRQKALANADIPTDMIDEEGDDMDTMTADSTAVKLTNRRI